jgi:hypothetical protein
MGGARSVLLLYGWYRWCNNALDGCEEVLRLNGLGYVVVHTRGQTALAIALHRMGGHGDNGHMA